MRPGWSATSASFVLCCPHAAADHQADQRATPTSQGIGEAGADSGDLMRTCAKCGSTMEERRCKLICRSRGYFMSCSDYY